MHTIEWKNVRESGNIKQIPKMAALYCIIRKNAVIIAASVTKYQQGKESQAGMTEMVKRLRMIRKRVNEKMREVYGEEVKIKGMKAFKKPDGSFATSTILTFPSGYSAIVTEFADSEEAANRYDWDDGDLYFLDDGTEEKIINAIIKEMTE